MLSRFFIDRPIFAAVLSIFIILAGLAAMRVLPIAQYPEISPPVVTLYTNSCWPLVGDSPTLPAANCAFCSLSARMMSPGASLSVARRSGRTQMRLSLIHI